MTVYETYMGEVPEWLQETLVRESGLSTGDRFEPFAEDKHRANDQISQWCEDLPPSFRCVPAELVEGHAASAILDKLKSEPYDLVIVGARRQGIIGRMLLGSTSYAILSHAPCSVLIVRAHEQPSVPKPADQSVAPAGAVPACDLTTYNCRQPPFSCWPNRSPTHLRRVAPNSWD